MKSKSRLGTGNGKFTMTKDRRKSAQLQNLRRRAEDQFHDEKKDVGLSLSQDEEISVTTNQLKTLLRLYQSPEPFRETADFVLEETARTTGSKLGFLGFVNEDETLVTTTVWSEQVMKDCGIDRKMVKFPIEGAGIWAEAVRQHRPVVVNDYSKPDPHKKGYPEGHVPLERLMSIPIIRQGRTVAIVAVANKKKNYTKSDLLHLQLFLETVWGIVQREKVEEDLRVNEERFRAIADYAYNWEVWEEPDHKYVYISPAVERITGYSVEEFMNDPELVVKIAHPDDREQYLEHLKEFATDRVFNFDYRIIDKSGNERWIHHLCHPVFNVDGRFIGRRITNRNITKLKQLKKELENHNLQLESLVKKRTAKLRAANEKLKKEIIKCREAEQLMLASRKEVEEKARELEEMNTALKILLKRREGDRNDLEEKVMLSVKQLVMPYVEELTSNSLNVKGRICLEAIRSGLKEITSPFLRRLSVNYMNLTPREIQVASLVREGKTTKEIADFMNVSPAAVSLHRIHLRNKLGLTNKKTSLQSLLSSLA